MKVEAAGGARLEPKFNMGLAGLGLIRRIGLRYAVMVLGLACLLGSGALAASAATMDDDDTPADGPKAPANARAVRLSSVEGQVQAVVDGQVIADPAYANLPLFEGSQIITANDGRAEIQFEDGSIARVSPNSVLTLSVLKNVGTGTKTELVLNKGLGYFELQPSIAEQRLRVNYGDASFTASNFSVVRLNVDQPPGELAVFTGNIHLERGSLLRLDVHAGEALSLDATDQNKYDLADSIEPDSWDNWNQDRDQLLGSEAADKTPASGAVGGGDNPAMSDLDANGSWYDVPGQGYVWSPYDAEAQGAAWDPYGYGHWVSYPQYGYVWVSGYAWGYAPFQCGLWNYYDSFGWGWAPGGGCSPWWRGGGGWGYRIGNGPGGYRPPHRPLPGPVHPHPHPVGPGGHPKDHPVVIAVDRRPGGTEIPAPVHRSDPVTIAGHTVEPVRPIAPRKPYDGGGSNSFTNGANGANGTNGSDGSGGGYFSTGTHTPYTGIRTGQPGQPGRVYTAPSRPMPAPSRPPSGGGFGGGRPSAPPPPPPMRSAPAAAPHK